MNWLRGLKRGRGSFDFIHLEHVFCKIAQSFFVFSGSSFMNVFEVTNYMNMPRLAIVFVLEFC